MNEKIQKMITELALECQKEDVFLSLAAFEENGNTSIARYGSNSHIELAIANQIADWERNVKTCSCARCKRRAAEIFEEERQGKHDSSDIPDWLASIIRGDF